MRRLKDWGYDKIIEYNLRDHGTAVTVFAEAQSARIRYSRWMLSHILEFCPEWPAIVELGCSSGDLSGHFSDRADVRGCDVVPAAVMATRERYPKMNVVESTVEDLSPSACDVLVMTEVLEHIVDPLKVCSEWLPLAEFSLISIPLLEAAHDPEPGHLWAYVLDDVNTLLGAGGHRVNEWIMFPSAYRTVLAIGERT